MYDSFNLDDSPMKQRSRSALLIDDRVPRAASIKAVLEQLEIRCIYHCEIVTKEMTGCAFENLLITSEEIDIADVLFIHLGPLEGDQKHSLGRRGNSCAMEFLLAHKVALQEKCIIAYGGGPDMPPEQFMKIRREGWHAYFPRVLKASALRLHAFFRGWNKALDGEPPLALLSLATEQTQNFKLLLAGYQRSYGIGSIRDGKSPAPIDLSKCSSWKGLFDGDRRYGELVKELKLLGEDDLLRMAEEIAATLEAAEIKDDPSRHHENCFNEELKRKLLAWGRGVVNP